MDTQDLVLALRVSVVEAALAALARLYLDVRFLARVHFQGAVVCAQAKVHFLLLIVSESDCLLRLNGTLARF